MVIISAIAHCSIRHNGPDFFGYKYDYGKGDDLNCMDHLVRVAKSDLNSIEAYFATKN